MKITDIIIWILFLISIVIAGWYVFGNLPTFEETLLILIISILFTLSVKVGQMGTKMNSLEKSFSHLAKDFKEHTKNK